MDPKIQELLDKKACEEVLLRSGRTLDWCDYSGLVSCFWSDAEIDYGFITTDTKGWANKMMEMEETLIGRWHMTTSCMINIDGNNAFAECYAIAVATRDEDGQIINTLFGGRFMDELEKRDQEWRISKRRYTLDWSCQAPDQNHILVSDENPFNILDKIGVGHPDYRPI